MSGTSEYKTHIALSSVLFEVIDGIPVEIAPSVLDLDFFEHIDKPYLTAVMSFVSFDASIDFLGIDGGERVRIEVMVQEEDDQSCRKPELIKKTFYLDKLIKSEKIKDDQEQYVAHLIEDIAFLSKTTNINRAYSGSGSDIISKISNEFLKTDEEGETKKIDMYGDAEQDFMKLIVPNMNPIESIHWVKNQLATNQGFPLYLYSSFIGEELQLVDLGYLLTQPVDNWDVPFTFSESTISKPDPTQKLHRRTILSYESRNTSDMFSLLDKGLIGADYTYIDVTKNQRNEFVFDVELDVNEKFKSKKIVKEKANIDTFQYDWMRSETPRTRSITQIGGTSSYKNWTSLSENEDVASYKNKVTARSMANVVTKDPILISVNGQDFFDGKTNRSIGRKIRVMFVKNDKVPEGEESNKETLFDKKKSGNFLIYACKHSIRQEGYTVSMSLVKVDVDSPEVTLI